MIESEVLESFRAVREELRLELGREPDDSELAGRLFPLSQPLSAKEMEQRARFRESQVEEIRHAADGLPPPERATPGRDRLEDAIIGLNRRERRLMRLRFGLADGCPRTLDEVCAELNVLREEVRRAEAQVLARLRTP